MSRNQKKEDHKASTNKRELNNKSLYRINVTKIFQKYDVC